MHAVWNSEENQTNGSRVLIITKFKLEEEEATTCTTLGKTLFSKIYYQLWSPFIQHFGNRKHSNWSTT